MLFDETLRDTPAFIRRRFSAINAYVWESLFPADERGSLTRDLIFRPHSPRFAQAREIVDEATMLVFVFVVYKMLLHGSEAAKETVDILKELNITGFRLGSTFFEDRNENVILGETLAHQLLKTLDPKARKLILNSEKVYQILHLYRPVVEELRG